MYLNLNNYVLIRYPYPSHVQKLSAHGIQVPEAFAVSLYT